MDIKKANENNKIRDMLTNKINKTVQSGESLLADDDDEDDVTKGVLLIGYIFMMIFIFFFLNHSLHLNVSLYRRVLRLTADLTHLALDSEITAYLA